ncbi:hypothetical protein [Flavobacterium sp.]|jgi:hypothetical protein|uniref:hypothetical protein n=1 Tax=Flavobacterium sp. TaxID=239 RepID=UPI0037BEE892
MAEKDFTEAPLIDRNTATRLNPFIGYMGYETQDSMSAGLEALSLSLGNLAQGAGERQVWGIQLFADTLRAALAFEQRAEGGAL